MDCIWHYGSPLGDITLFGEGDALTGLWFDGQRFFGAGQPFSQTETRLPVFDDAVRWLDLYFSGRVPDFTPRLCPRGTPFRQAVWEILLTIPYGETVSYGEVAASLAKKRGTAVAAQAVGGAVGHNPIALIVPCHRVIGADGSLTGYGGGMERKAVLLEMEKKNFG